MSDKWKNKHIDDLFEAILLLGDIRECYMFFEDLCTVSELHLMAQRLEVARLLGEGLPYREISKRTKASAATISRVSKCLHYGADGYRLILDKQRGNT